MCERIGVTPSQGNKEVVKAMLKKASGIETLGRTTDDDSFTHNLRLARFITHSAMLLSSEFGIEVDMPNEFGSDKSLQDFFKMVYDNG